MDDLTLVPSGTRIFVDASILALYFTDHVHLADDCEAFLLRCTRKDLIGFTSVIAASEAIHRVLVHEARTRLGFATSPETVKELRQHMIVASKIYHLGIEILPVSYKDLHRGQSGASAVWSDDQ